MAPSTRKNLALSRKIATLQLTLAPFVPLPSGPPHPAFPKTLMAYHLLTEEELDSLAHYYHQATPGIWTYQYPTTMNWDKEFLAKPSPTTEALAKTRRLSRQQETFLQDVMKTIHDLHNPEPQNMAKLTDSERVRIKRRKVGKFIGLVGMDTPVEEIAGRLQVNIDRAIERSRQDLRRNEEIMTRRKKGGY